MTSILNALPHYPEFLQIRQRCLNSENILGQEEIMVFSISTFPSMFSSFFLKTNLNNLSHILLNCHFQTF